MQTSLLLGIPPTLVFNVKIMISTLLNQNIFSRIFVGAQKSSLKLIEIKKTKKYRVPVASQEIHVCSLYGHLMKKVLTSSTNKNVTPGRLPFTLRDDSMLDLVCHRISDRCKDILMGFWWKEACFPKELQT